MAKISGFESSKVIFARANLGGVLYMGPHCAAHASQAFTNTASHLLLVPSLGCLQPELNNASPLFTAYSGLRASPTTICLGASLVGSP